MNEEFENEEEREQPQQEMNLWSKNKETNIKFKLNEQRLNK